MHNWKFTTHFIEVTEFNGLVNIFFDLVQASPPIKIHVLIKF